VFRTVDSTCHQGFTHSSLRLQAAAGYIRCSRQQALLLRAPPPPSSRAAAPAYAGLASLRQGAIARRRCQYHPAQGDTRPPGAKSPSSSAAGGSLSPRCYTAAQSMGQACTKEEEEEGGGAVEVWVMFCGS
jgi:hypothetical protein